MSRPRIAIIDDDVEIVSLLCQVFDMEGWIVIPCPAGAHALSALQASSPDVVLLDIRMDTPDRGWQILRNLGQAGQGQNTGVVICSGAPLPHGWPSDLSRDDVEIVRKPFQLDELLAAVGGALERRTLRSVPAAS